MVYFISWCLFNPFHVIYFHLFLIYIYIHLFSFMFIYFNLLHVFLFIFISFHFFSCSVFFLSWKTVTNLNHLHADPRLSSADLNAGAFTYSFSILRRITWKSLNIAILPQFLAIEPRFVRKGRAGQVEIAILHQFLAIEPHFVRKGGTSWNRNFTSVFDDRTSFRAKGCAGRLANRNFTQVFGDQTSFRAEGCAGRLANRNFTSVFGDRASFRAKRVCRTSWNRNFTTVFGDRTSFRAKGLRGTTCKSQFYLSFWRSNLISCGGCAGRLANRNFTSVFGDQTSFRAKGCAGQVEIAILPQFLAIETSFRAKGLRFVPSRWHCPCPRLQKRNRKEGEGKRQEGKSARGQEGKRARCSDVEKVHAVVARNTFRSQNVKNTRGSDHFWRFRCRFAWQAQGIVHLVKVSKTWRLCSIFNYNHHYTTLHSNTFHYTIQLQLQLHLHYILIH